MLTQFLFPQLLSIDCYQFTPYLLQTLAISWLPHKRDNLDTDMQK